MACPAPFVALWGGTLFDGAEPGSACGAVRKEVAYGQVAGLPAVTEFALSVFADDLGNSEVRSRSLRLGVFLTTRFACLRHLPSGSVSLQDQS